MGFSSDQTTNQVDGRLSARVCKSDLSELCVALPDAAQRISPVLPHLGKPARIAKRFFLGRWAKFKHGFMLWNSVWGGKKGGIDASDGEIASASFDSAMTNEEHVQNYTPAKLWQAKRRFDQIGDNRVKTQNSGLCETVTTLNVSGSLCTVAAGSSRSAMALPQGTCGVDGAWITAPLPHAVTRGVPRSQSEQVAVLGVSETLNSSLFCSDGTCIHEAEALCGGSVDVRALYTWSNSSPYAWLATAEPFNPVIRVLTRADANMGEVVRSIGPPPYQHGA